VRKTLFVVLASFVFCSNGLSQDRGTRTDYRDAIETAEQFMQDSLKTSRIPGASITVSIKGKIIWSEGFGYADLEQQVPVTPETKFRVGSVSKSLTSAALGLLYEEGKINLDTLIQVYVPSFPVKRYPVTVREVAGHIAGIRHYRDDEMLLVRRFPSVTAGLSIFEDDTLLFKPGTRFSYSSYGWNLVSAVIEGASGEDFLAFMHDRVFRPLGMWNTVPDYTDSLIAHRARWYTEDSLHRILNAPYVDNSYKWAGGGFLSTTEDLVKFGNAMLDATLLKPATINVMFTPQTLNDGKETQYGLGWFIRHDKAGRLVVSHTGGSVGGTAHLLLYPDEDVVVALLVNSDMRFIQHAPQIAELFLSH
jgi:serine beta-lactamase-like protein LACTB, mitochondrial